MPPPPLPLSPCLPSLRHISSPHRTTIKLESSFWAVIDLLAEKTGRTWSEWVATELMGKPVDTGAASWLRVRCLIQSTKEHDEHGDCKKATGSNTGQARP